MRSSFDINHLTGLNSAHLGEKTDIQISAESIEKAGVNLVEYINDSMRNTAMVVIGNYLFIVNGNVGIGGGFIIAGSFFQLTNIFKIKSMSTTAAPNILRSIYMKFISIFISIPHKIIFFVK